jgi:uncharacterized protein YcbK (DUF882 family)
MKLTTNFNLSEFRCKDDTDVPAELLPNVQKLANELQKLRDELGLPIKINSGYRTKTYNKKIGGATNSMHVQAKAADIVVTDISPTNLYKRIEKLIEEGKVNFKGVGVYDTFVHVDVRDRRSRWDERTR